MLCYKLTSNCSNKKFLILLLVQRTPGGLQLWNLESSPKNPKLRKIHHIRMIISFITYPLSPKIKPMHQVYANVSKLLPPPPYSKFWYLSKKNDAGPLFSAVAKIMFLLHFSPN